jgi:Ca2+-transporting ATPase
VFEREPAAGDVMRRPPRDPRRSVLGLRLLAAGVADGALMLVAATVVYAFAWTSGCDDARVAAAAFTSVVVGNVGLIAVNRSGGLAGVLRTPNPAFWAVVAGAAAALGATLWLRPIGRFFRFETPPAGVLALALALPLAIVALMFLVRGRAGSAPLRRA